MMNECKIVEDLLPLYAEELVSRETAEFIGEHCDRCDRCRKLLERSKVVLPVETVDTGDYQKALKKERTHSAMLGALFATVMIVLSMLALVFVAGHVPVKLDREPIILVSPDGIHSFKGEYYTSPLGLNRGIYFTEKSAVGEGQGTNEDWIEILDAQWSPDGTDLFFTVEMKNGETEMEIWYHNYSETGGRGGIFPLISRTEDRRDYNDLTAEFTKLLAQWEKFPTGWDSITYEFVGWGEDSESAYIRCKTDNGYEDVVYFGFDFEGQSIRIIE